MSVFKRRQGLGPMCLRDATGTLSRSTAKQTLYSLGNRCFTHVSLLVVVVNKFGCYFCRASVEFDKSRCCVLVVL